MQEISQGRLRYFHEVVACGSVRARPKLDTAASVVSRQIQLLERSWAWRCSSAARAD